MVSKWIGLEFGSTTVKLTVTEGGQVLSMVSARLPEGMMREGRITAPAAMAAFLKNIMKENGIRGGRCALAMPPQSVICQPITLPVMSEAELLLNLPFEFKDYIGKDSEEFDYDYIVVGIHDGLMDLYAAAARRSIVEEYWFLCKKAGLHLKLAIPTEMAWQNLLRRENLPRKLAIVDIGHNSTRVSIFSEGNFVMGKEIELAGRRFDEVIAAKEHMDQHLARSQKEANVHQIQSAEYLLPAYEALAIEIMKAVNFYNYSNAPDDTPLRDLFCCGGSSMIEGLRAAITRVTGLTIQPISSLLTLKEIPVDVALTCSISAGAALQSP